MITSAASVRRIAKPRPRSGVPVSPPCESQQRREHTHGPVVGAAVRWEGLSRAWARDDRKDVHDPKRRVRRLPARRSVCGGRRVSLVHHVSPSRLRAGCSADLRRWQRPRRVPPRRVHCGLRPCRSERLGRKKLSLRDSRGFVVAHVALLIAKRPQLGAPVNIRQRLHRNGLQRLREFDGQPSRSCVRRTPSRPARVRRRSRSASCARLGPVGSASRLPRGGVARGRRQLKRVS
jgi:hypothetical protein